MRFDVFTLFPVERMSPFLEPERVLTERDWNFEVVARAR